MRLIKFQPVALICLFVLMLCFSLWGSINTPLAAAETTPLIAFSSLSGSGEQLKNGLFTIKPNGQGRKLLTPTLKDIGSPIVWSSNGQRIAFIGNELPYIINTNGSSLKQLLKDTSCGRVPSYDIRWLPDNKQIAFTQSCDGSTLEDPGALRLYLSDTTKKQGTKLIQDFTSATSSGLFLSPNGKRVAFVKDNDIYVMNTDGSQTINLTKKPGDYSSGGNPLSWSPDGTRIAFYMGKYPQQQLYVINADGSNLTNLTNNPENQVYNLNVAWSPDSKRIAFYHSESGDNLGTKQNIYLVDAKGGKPINLTNKPGEYNELSWSPDGQQIAFTVGELSQQKIYTIQPNGRGLTNLTRNPFSSIFLGWATDSKRIAFTADRGSLGSAIYIINRDGSGLRKLTKNGDVNDFFPTWQPLSR